MGRDLQPCKTQLLQLWDALMTIAVEAESIFFELGEPECLCSENGKHRYS
jgi:hypothetical protein